VDIHQRRIGFRFNSVRTLLGLSLFELARLLNRSHYTLSAIERSIRYPADELTHAIVELAAGHQMTLSYNWLMGEEGASLPTSTYSALQQKITIENHIEACLIHADDAEHRKKFGHRLSILLKNMAFSSLQFAKWAQVSVGTVHQWLEGNSLPKRDTMRFMINKIKRENIPLSLDWFCVGSGVLEPFQYVVPPDHNDQKDEGIVQVKIDSSLFEPYISRNTKISAYPYPTSLFIANWGWFYLYCYEGQWIPVQLESTKQLDVFHVMSLHNKLSDRIFLKNVQCAIIYPIIYLEKMYPVKLKMAN
jgi:transcriptional regulator with XRE-family HTH domain